MSSPFSPGDVAFIRARGGRLDYVQRQFEILSKPPPPIRLVRPCRLDDGIKKLAPRARELGKIWESSTEKGMLKFVPASGVASRMFSFLPVPRGTGSVSIEHLRSRSQGGDADAEQTLRLLDQIDGLAAFADLERLVGDRTGRVWSDLRNNDPGLLLALLVDAEGLGLADLPKGLLPFHRYESLTRTAFEEHLVEGAGYLATGPSPARYHFTVSAEHEDLFRRRLDTSRPSLERDIGRPLAVGFSNQEPSTDTIAIDSHGEPLRDETGELLFRPAGHGSLLGNLAGLAEEGIDLVFIKNIDNVPAERHHPLVAEWKRLLAGHALELRHEAFELIDRLEQGAADPETVTRAADFVRSELAVVLPDDFRDMPDATRAQLLVDRLDRPLRVAGVVINRGEPGGGPFWVARVDGSVDGQIVESAQINRDDSEQSRIWADSTHFNPVDIVCAVLDRTGKPYDLQQFVDQSTYFVTTKDHEGRQISILERPGLWNGAMAAWNTAFVEVPEETFSPVKTLVDLVRAAHRSG